MVSIEEYSHRILDIKDEALENRINIRAKRMCRARKQGNDALVLKYREDIAIMCLNYFYIVSDFEVIENDGVLIDTLNLLLDRYDPESGPFTWSVRFYFAHRTIDEGNKMRRQYEREQTIHADSDDDKGSGLITAAELKQDNRAQTEFEAIAEKLDGSSSRKAVEAIVVELVSLVIAFRENVKDARLATRREYTPLFFTELIVRICKEQDDSAELAPMQKHEASIFKAMEIPFLDFFMSDICRCILAIWGTDIKEAYLLYENRLEDVQKGSSVYRAFTLPALAYKRYLKESRGKTVQDATISQQRAAFNKLMATLKVPGTQQEEPS